MDSKAFVDSAELLAIIHNYHTMLVNLTPTFGGQIIPNINAEGIRFAFELDGVPEERWQLYTQLIVQYMTTHYSESEVLGQNQQKEETNGG